MACEDSPLQSGTVLHTEVVIGEHLDFQGKTLLRLSVSPSIHSMNIELYTVFDRLETMLNAGARRVSRG